MPMPPRPYGLLSAFDQADPTSPLADTLGMQEQPFYSPATGISQGGYDYMGDLGAALLAGSGWHAGPSSFGENLGQAMQSAEASHSDRLRTQMRTRLQGYELKRQQRADKLEEQDRARAEAQAQQEAAYISTLPPELQAAARFNREALGKRIAEQALPDPVQPEYKTIGNQMYEVLPGQQPHLVASAPFSPPAPREDPPVAVMKDGQIVYVRRSEAYGMTPAPQAPLVQVGGGKAPEGYRWKDETQQELEPIAGGPKDPNATSAITTDQRNKLATARQATGNILSQMDRLESLVNSPDAGVTKGGATLWPSEQNAKLEAVHTSVLMEMKNLLELGVLNGNDEALINRMIPNPAGWSSMATSPLVGLQEARRYISGKLSAAESNFGGGSHPEPGGNLYDGVPGAQPIPRRTEPHPAPGAVATPGQAAPSADVDQYLKDLGL